MPEVIHAGWLSFAREVVVVTPHHGNTSGPALLIVAVGRRIHGYSPHVPIPDDPLIIIIAQLYVSR
jgi:mRNA-degrading endonuclease toxin of MazEF toxin-antitoxin module